MNCLNILKSNPFYDYNKLDIDEKKLSGRLEFICEFFKNFTEKSGQCIFFLNIILYPIFNFTLKYKN